MAASWRTMTAEWAGVRESGKAMAEAEALRQSAEEKRWRAGEALAAAVLDAASAEESREYAERARQVVCLPSGVQCRQLLACLLPCLLDASCGPGEVALLALRLWAPWTLTASMACRMMMQAADERRSGEHKQMLERMMALRDEQVVVQALVNECMPHRPVANRSLAWSASGRARSSPLPALVFESTSYSHFWVALGCAALASAPRCPLPALARMRARGGSGAAGRLPSSLRCREAGTAAPWSSLAPRLQWPSAQSPAAARSFGRRGGGSTAAKIGQVRDATPEVHTCGLLDVSGWHTGWGGGAEEGTAGAWTQNGWAAEEPAGRGGEAAQPPPN